VFPANAKVNQWRVGGTEKKNNSEL